MGIVWENTTPSILITPWLLCRDRVTFLLFLSIWTFLFECIYMYLTFKRHIYVTKSQTSHNNMQKTLLRISFDTSKKSKKSLEQTFVQLSSFWLPNVNHCSVGVVTAHSLCLFFCQEVPHLHIPRLHFPFFCQEVPYLHVSHMLKLVPISNLHWQGVRHYFESCLNCFDCLCCML